MYQPYPSGGPEQLLPQAGPQPQPVRTAVLFMYAGAALNAVQIILGLITIGSLKSIIRSRYPNYSVSQIHAAQIAGVVAVVLVGAIAIGIWLWMAWANGRGRSWARIVATVLFGLNTISLLSEIARPHTAIVLLFEALIWLAGLGAIIFLWQRESSAYFQATSGRPR
jgi:hypothetical protein